MVSHAVCHVNVTLRVLCLNYLLKRIYLNLPLTNLNLPTYVHHYCYYQDYMYSDESWVSMPYYMTSVNGVSSVNIIQYTHILPYIRFWITLIITYIPTYRL